MRRWIAYSGTPVLLSQVLFQSAHSLIDQSPHSRTGVETTNGDGFGRYPKEPAVPAVLRDAGPAWNNRNLREAAQHTRSRPFFGHIRASTGMAVQQSNRHPVRSGHWRWMHDGVISESHQLLALTVDPARYADKKTADAHGVTPPLQMSIAVTDGARVWDLPGAWSEVAESSCGVIHPGGDVLLASRPEHTDGPLSMR